MRAGGKKLLVLFGGPDKKKTSLTPVSGIDMRHDGV
tara:strand:+ start:467 stop:574 length:108 start_codon:yes stop_codon:yes gene_type:complete